MTNDDKIHTTHIILTADDIAKIAADTHRIARFVSGHAVMEEKDEQPED